MQAMRLYDPETCARYRRLDGRPSRRTEGRTTKGSPSGARESARALLTIAKAQVDHQKLGARLAEVAEALAATSGNM